MDTIKAWIYEELERRGRLTDENVRRVVDALPDLVTPKDVAIIVRDMFDGGDLRRAG